MVGIASVMANEMAFKLAGSFGFKDGLARSKPALLEPIMDAEITIPDSRMPCCLRPRVGGLASIGVNTMQRSTSPLQ